MKLVLIGLLASIVLVAAIGVSLPNERSSKRKSIIKADIEKVFSRVTEISNQSWRSQIETVEIVDSTPGQEVWIEKPKRGPSMKFRTKVKNHPGRFEIEIIDNPRIGGHWVGTFNSTPNGETEVEFAEHVVVHGLIPKLMSYVFFDIDQSVDTYIDDLKRAVE